MCVVYNLPGSFVGPSNAQVASPVSYSHRENGIGLSSPLPYLLNVDLFSH